MLPLLTHSIHYAGRNSILTHLTNGAIPRERQERAAVKITLRYSKISKSVPELPSIIDVALFMRNTNLSHRNYDYTKVWPQANLNNSGPVGCGENSLVLWEIEPQFLVRRLVTTPTELLRLYGQKNTPFRELCVSSHD